MPAMRQYPYTLKTGTVVSVGLMQRTVRVSHQHTVFDRLINKPYPKSTIYLVADPRDSLREGDVIEFSSGYPKSRRVRHVVERIIAPFGSGIEERPPIMTRAERDELRATKMMQKLLRREAKRAEGAPKGSESRASQSTPTKAQIRAQVRAQARAQIKAERKAKREAKEAQKEAHEESTKNAHTASPAHSEPEQSEDNPSLENNVQASQPASNADRSTESEIWSWKEWKMVKK